MRTIKWTLGIGILLLLPKAHLGLAAAPTEAELSAQALDAELHTVAPANQSLVIAERAQKLRNLASEAPDRVTGATVVFKGGQESKALEKLATNGGFEISAVEVKVPVGADGKVFTIWLGERSLTTLSGSLSERLEKALGRQRYQFMNLAATKEGPEGQQFLEVAHSPQMLTYKAHVVGVARNVSKLLDNAGISAVLMDERPERVNAYQQLKSRQGALTQLVIKGTSSADLEALKASGRKIPEGAQNAPVIMH